MNHVREMFDHAAENKEKTEELIGYLKNNPSFPLSDGYLGSAIILLSKFSLNPLSKYNYFVEGRDKLERAIGIDPGSVELRYLRFAIQTHLPGFLNYRKHIEADKIFLINSILHPSPATAEIKQRIRRLLLSSSFCSEEEKKIIR